MVGAMSGRTRFVIALCSLSLLGGCAYDVAPARDALLIPGCQFPMQGLLRDAAGDIGGEVQLRVSAVEGEADAQITYQGTIGAYAAGGSASVVAIELVAPDGTSAWADVSKEDVLSPGASFAGYGRIPPELAARLTSLPASYRVIVQPSATTGGDLEAELESAESRVPAELREAPRNCFGPAS